ncbi:threonine aldolase family protein [Paenibacillus gansuensis]|uniref:Threonine aldolase family protein n=1 Tax=Paenibacillus gansuensis TaxID=306542 RepID=A0ABW5PEK8_9BACL
MTGTSKTLLEAYNNSAHPLTGHSPRTIEVLTKALAAWDPETESDIYGTGRVISQFESKLASYLGKPSAVFFPSGTMAQQIALRIWCDEKGSRKAAYHPLCHLEIHEEDGLKELHGIEPVLLADKDRLITLEDVKSLPEDTACLLLELPQREIGGQLPDYEELEAISTYCRKRKIRIHMDGARLYEILPYYGKTAAEVCSLFDSVYVSMYKGVGGVAGAILAGDETFTKQSKVWKRRHGGDLISLYPYILSSEYYFDERVARMGTYYEGAKELAAMFNQCHGVSTVPQIPVSNMFHVHLKGTKETLEPLLLRINEETGIGFTTRLWEVTPSSCYFEVSIGDRYTAVPKERLYEAFRKLHEAMEKAV